MNSITILTSDKLYMLDEAKCLENLFKTNDSNDILGRMVAVVTNNELFFAEVVSIESDSVCVTHDFEKIGIFKFNQVYLSWKEKPIERSVDKDLKEHFIAGIRSISNVANSMIDHYLHLQDNAILSEEVKVKQKDLEKSLNDLANATVSHSKITIPRLSDSDSTK